MPRTWHIGMHRPLPAAGRPPGPLRCGWVPQFVGRRGRDTAAPPPQAARSTHVRRTLPFPVGTIAVHRHGHPPRRPRATAAASMPAAVATALVTAAVAAAPAVSVAGDAAVGAAAAASARQFKCQRPTRPVCARARACGRGHLSLARSERPTAHTRRRHVPPCAVGVAPPRTPPHGCMPPLSLKPPTVSCVAPSAHTAPRHTPPAQAPLLRSMHARAITHGRGIPSLSASFAARNATLARPPYAGVARACRRTQ